MHKWHRVMILVTTQTSKSSSDIQNCLHIEPAPGTFAPFDKNLKVFFNYSISTMKQIAILAF